MVIKNNVKKQRMRLKMSQTKLAEKTGVGQSTISDIENCLHLPGIDVVLLLSKAMSCTVEELFELVEGE